MGGELRHSLGLICTDYKDKSHASLSVLCTGSFWGSGVVDAELY